MNLSSGSPNLISCVCSSSCCPNLYDIVLFYIGVYSTVIVLIFVSPSYSTRKLDLNVVIFALLCYLHMLAWFKCWIGDWRRFENTVNPFPCYLPREHWNMVTYDRWSLNTGLFIWYEIYCEEKTRLRSHNTSYCLK